MGAILTFAGTRAACPPLDFSTFLGVSALGAGALDWTLFPQFPQNFADASTLWPQLVQNATLELP